MKKQLRKKDKGPAEFVDAEGKKWIQTSTEDLFSIKELSNIIDTFDNKDDESGDIILARIDFQKVNKDYYEKVVELQKRLKNKIEIQKRIVSETRRIIEKKNNKLKELIEYIRRIHLLFSYYNLKPEEFAGIKIPEDILKEILKSREFIPVKEDVEPEDIEYSDVQEILLNSDGHEAGTVQ